MYKLLTAIILVPGCVSFISSSSAQNFDCSKASNAVEKLICTDDELKSLDSKMASLYNRALSRLSARDKRMLRNEQVGWLKARNECAGFDGMRACIAEFYEQRISRLDQIGSGSSQLLVLASASTEVIYSGNDPVVAQVVATFTGPDNVRVEFADSTWDLIRVQSGSGVKYTNKDVMFWTKGDEATIEYRKKSYKCKESK